MKVGVSRIMRVVNDRDEKKATTQIDFFAVVAHGAICALGFSSLLLGPFAVLGSYAKLQEPWPKVAALLGAILALTLFQVSPVVVVIIFAFSLYVGDSVWRETPLPKLLVSSAFLAALLGVAGLVLLAQMNKMDVFSYGDYIVSQVVEQLESAKKTFSFYQSIDAEVLRRYLKLEGPFIYLSGMLLSLWLSVGMAAHFKWFPKGHAYASENLRTFSYPIWVTGLFVAFLLVEWIIGGRVPYVIDGILSCLGIFMFISGSIALSVLLNKRGVTTGQRTLIYCVSVFLLLYFVIILGVLAPWINRKPKQVEEV